MHKCLTVALLSVTLVGCHTLKEPDILPTPDSNKSEALRAQQLQKEMDEINKGAPVVASKLSATANTINDRAEAIKDNVDKARTATPDPVKTKLEPAFVDIHANAVKIQADTKDIHSISTDINKASGKINEIANAINVLQTRVTELEGQLKFSEEQYVKLQKAMEVQKDAYEVKLEDAKSECTKALNTRMIALIALGILIIAGCVAATAFGTTWAVYGVYGGAACVITSMAVMAISKFSFWYGMIGCIGFIALIAVGIWYAIDYLQHKLALTETTKASILSTQSLAQGVKDEVQVATDKINGIVHSSTTQNLISKIQDKVTIVEDDAKTTWQTLEDKLDSLFHKHTQAVVTAVKNPTVAVDATVTPPAPTAGVTPEVTVKIV